MKPVPWFVACAIAGCAAVGGALPAAAQTPPPTLPATPADNRRVTLADAVETAWQRAVQAREAQAQGRRAQAEQTAASSLWAAPPSLELNHRNDRWQTNAGRRENEVGVALPLWQPGQRDARSAAAGAELRLADTQTRAARLRVAGQVREAAWRWSAAQAEAVAAAAQVQYLQRLANDVQRRVHSGDLARADALAARAELLDAQSLLGEVRQRLLAAQAQWRNLTGLEAMPEVATPSTLFAGLDAETSEEHPELQLAAQAMERARKRVEVVNTSRRDAPELLLRYREESPGTGQAAQRSVGIGVRIPFGTDGRNAPLQAAALGDLDVAETTELRLRERQEADLGLARSAVRNAARQLEDARDRASLLRERTQLIDKSFQAGETPLPELLRAANAAAQADAALARQQAALGLAQALLQQTLGLLP